jgi:chaperonin GroEL
MSSQKEIAFKDKARESLKNGVDFLCNAVKTTLGAKGRFVVIRGKDGKAHATKDGVTVAENVDTVDIIEQLGVDMVREASIKAAKDAGDGTTTATVLAQAMVSEGHKYVTAGANPIDLKRGIDKAVAQVVEQLDIMSKEVSIKSGLLKQVATISANGDEVIGELVSTAFSTVGEKGMVTVETSETQETYSEIVEGVKIERGYALHHFITSESTKEAILEKPYILLYDDKIVSFRELSPILTEIGQQGRAILIIANDYEPEVLHTLAANKVRGFLKVNAIKTPNFGELNRETLSDIAVATGANVISAKAGGSLETVLIQDLGYAEKVVSDSLQTMIIEGDVDEEDLKTYITGLEELSKKDKYAKERIARLTGGIAVIKVGAFTDIEMKEKKDRVDDAVAAVKAAVSEGVVIGGGAALIRAAVAITDDSDNFDERLGIQIVRKALNSPLITIVENGGENGEVALYLVENNDNMDIGYDVVSRSLVNMYEKGIIDPKKVTRVALESASSVAGTILTTDCVIASY